MVASTARILRKNFGKIKDATKIPSLIETQLNSYKSFLQLDVPIEKRKDVGLQGILKSVFPITDFSDRAQIEYVHYTFDQPKYDVDECLRGGYTYAAPMRALLRLIVWDIDEDAGTRSIQDIKEQDVYLADIPLMTQDGTFIINGIERVVVSQMHRSPGVFFGHDEGKTHASGKLLFNARVVPNRGSWLDFEFDSKDHINIRIDRRKKLLATTFLMALDSSVSEQKRAEAIKKGKTIDEAEISGMSREEILRTFYDVIEYKVSGSDWKIPFVPNRWRGVKVARDLIDAKTKDVILEAGTKVTPRILKKLEAEGAREILVPKEDIIGKRLATMIVNADTGEVVADPGAEISREIFEYICDHKLKKLDVLYIDHVNVGSALCDTLVADKNQSREDALVDIYRVMRPGEPPTLENAAALFHSLFFDADRYDLSPVGRVKINARLNLDTDSEQTVLDKKDIIEMVRTLADLKDGRGEVDDIDHLGNRRIRSVGELLENQIRMGLLRMERSIRERMNSADFETLMPYDFINAKPVSSALRDFFNSSQLSQFMDQTNPLSEITHKRRLSALGPGGLTRDRAGFEVRDVHPTHYGRICPIETPEGPNIGLINSLATFARINQYGLIESPYRPVINGKIQNEVVYLSAIEESKACIAQSDVEIDDKGCIVGEFITCRHKGEFTKVALEDIQYIEVSPKQLVSVATSLIPFLENDDPTRALMGSNMQRQAVPLLRTEAPLIGTGMEKNVAEDSGVIVLAKRSGVVDQVDGNRIVVKTDESDSEAVEVGVDIYTLNKFQRSNMGTCMNQRPLVRVGERVTEGQVIADGPSTDRGELALGYNVLVAFMSWNGYNFEDSIMISEKIVSDDVFTSIHIDEFEIMARDTKLGNEEITRDIPNVGEEALRQLDESGIVYIGADVKPGDILVGKVTPKGETPSTPEEKLLRAIFGEKASDVRDTSLRVPPGVKGTIVDVRVFSRRGVEKDERSLAIEQAEIEELNKNKVAEKRILERNFQDRLKDLLLDQIVAKGPKGIKIGDRINEDLLGQYTPGQWMQIVVKEATVQKKITAVTADYDQIMKGIDKRFQEKIEKIRMGDELAPGVLKSVKVFIAVKRKLQPGDKMAGRHGNKGVISRITPVEDMPYLEDGTPVDIVLNPLGLPSRMNVGQILETHLGWASNGLGKQVNMLLSEVEKDKGKIKELDASLDKIYVGKEEKDFLKTLSFEEKSDLVKSMKKGIPMATPVFDGASVKDVDACLKLGGLDTSGQVTLYDGITGQPFERPVTVGYKYMLKLHHLVDDKIHARSIGPYSLVTQQPLGGKAQFGGQRFGEMEVWALEAYGAAYTLQEMLTVKSDDVTGRTKVYESIIRGDNNFEVGVPESFNVLVKEIKSLGLNMEFIEGKEDIELEEKADPQEIVAELES
jgi:DNA-directed RNA polymerase subunit beta